MVKKGYKQTEIGVIPEDWEVKRLDMVFNFLKTANYSRSQVSNKHKTQYLHYGDIHTKYNFLLDFSKEQLPTVKDEQAKPYSFLKNGDIVMVDASEDYEGICKSVEIQNVNNIKAIAGLHTFLLRDKNNNYIDGFRGYIINSYLLKQQFDKLATGMKVYGLSKNNLKIVLLPIPPKKEQEAIAKILSDTDALIESLESLIAKKTSIKKATMQQLLTGKKRLKGFSEEWVEKKLGDVAKLYQSQTISQNNLTKDGFLVFGANGIIGKYPFYNHEKWQIIITCRGSTSGTVSKTSDYCWITGNAMVVNLEHNNSVNKTFIYYLLKYQNFKSLVTGSGQPQIVRKPLYEYIITFPQDITEQKAIAKILSDMDKEIEALKEKLEKTKAIKQGMMQELLSGRIRLIKKDSHDT